MSASPVLSKTTQGRIELASDSYCLDLKSRQVLILADGVRTLSQMQQIRPMLDVSTTAGKLIAAGYLEIKSGDFPALINIAPEVAMPVAPVETKEISIELLEKARCIMIESTRAHIGLLGNDMIRRISLAKNAVQIKSCIAEWHMALRGSRQGREVANQQLNQVNVALGLPTENTWIE